MTSFYRQHKHTIIHIMRAGVGVTGLAILAYYKLSFVPPLERAEDRVLRAFEEGRGLTGHGEPAVRVDRSDLERVLKHKLRDSELRKYILIVGERGTGKSTAVTRSLSDSQTPNGAVYILCPVAVTKFSTNLAKLIDCIEPTDVGRGIQRRIEGTTKQEESASTNEPQATFSTLEDHLVAAAVKFKAKHKRPAILVIDGADRLARKDPAFLTFLQEFAKDVADAGILRVVFVSSDGSTLPLMMASSAWSRAEDAFEVGEISDEDAEDYLVRRRVCKEDAKLAVANLTGGLFVALERYLGKYNEVAFKDMLKKEDEELLNKVTAADVSSSHALFRELLRDRNVPISRTRQLGMPRTTVDRLLAENVLSLHPNSTYTFHDRHAASWFRRQLALDISDADAVKYLVAKGVRVDDAQQAVANLTGGEVGALDSFAKTRQGGSSYSQILADKDEELRNKMTAASVSTSHALFRELLRDLSVPLDRPNDLGMPRTIVDRLLAENILSLHPNSTYTFHDRHAASWFRRQQASWWSWGSR